MKVIFNSHRGNKIISKIIRLLSPKFNHISIRLVDELEDVIYEADMGKIIIPEDFKTWKGKKTVVKTTEYEVDEETYVKVKDFLVKQIGKGYDYLGILSFVWVFLKPRRGRWYCSELAMVTLLKMLNIKMSKVDIYQRVTPYQFSRMDDVIHSIYYTKK